MMFSLTIPINLLLVFLVRFTSERPDVENVVIAYLQLLKMVYTTLGLELSFPVDCHPCAEAVGETWDAVFVSRMCMHSNVDCSLDNDRELKIILSF